MKISKKIITVDGFTGSGKTTFSKKYLDEGISVISADDFFYPPGAKRHPLSGNFDAPRFIREVIPRLSGVGSFTIRAYDCKSGRYFPKNIKRTEFYVLEGSYSSTPLLNPYRLYGIFLKMDEKTRHLRLKRREKDGYERFIEVWERMEKDYFIEHGSYKNMKIVEV